MGGDGSCAKGADCGIFLLSESGMNSATVNFGIPSAFYREYFYYWFGFWSPAGVLGRAARR